MARVVERFDRCVGCNPDYYSTIKQFAKDNQASLAAFEEHGVILKVSDEHKCPRCGNKLLFKEARNQFYCTHSYYPPKNKKKRIRCDFTISRYNGTFLAASHLEPWQILLFVCEWLRKHFNHNQVQENLNITRPTSVDWRSFCSEVVEFWFKNQDPIGGPGQVVEVDETLIARRKYNRGRVVQQVWLFGGIERVGKKRFVVPLLGEDGHTVLPRDKDTLTNLIKQFIHPGSTVYSDCWKGYCGLSEEGFVHSTINHSLHFVDPADKELHTQNIERLWLDVKQYIRRPGIRAKFLTQYLARYLFLKEKKGNEFHSFLTHAAKLYPPTLTPAANRPRPNPVTLEENDLDDDCVLVPTDPDEPSP